MLELEYSNTLRHVWFEVFHFTISLCVLIFLSISVCCSILYILDFTNKLELLEYNAPEYSSYCKEIILLMYLQRNAKQKGIKSLT